MVEIAPDRRQKIRGLPLTPLIDVVFILIIFFMLTTSFMRIESLELILPSKGGKAAEKQEVVRVYLHENGDIKIGRQILDIGEMDDALAKIFTADPDTRMMVLTTDGVTMQQMVNVMDHINAAGGKSIFVRKWVKK